MKQKGWVRGGMVGCFVWEKVCRLAPIMIIMRWQTVTTLEISV